MTTTTVPVATPAVPIVQLAFLRSLGACSEQVAAFKRLFGSYAELTVENVIRAREADLSIEWLAEELGVSRAYNEAIATASRAYNEAIAPARRAYDEATAPIFVEIVGRALIARAAGADS